MRARVLCSDYRACMAPWDVNIESRREGDGYLLAARGLCPSDPVAPARALAPVAKAIASLRNVIWLSHPWKAGAHIYFRFSLSRSLALRRSRSLFLFRSKQSFAPRRTGGAYFFLFFLMSFNFERGGAPQDLRAHPRAVALARGLHLCARLYIYINVSHIYASLYYLRCWLVNDNCCEICRVRSQRSKHARDWQCR